MKTNRIKRLFTLVMIVLIITGMTIPASLAANPNGSTTIKISNANELQNYFKNSTGQTGVLMNNITAPKGKAFVLPKGQNAILDLHGNTLTGRKGYEVITISDGGNLTIRDTVGTGKITHNGKEGRGIFIRNGSVVMEGGNITQNKLEPYVSSFSTALHWGCDGCGVYVKKGTFTMKGGSITQNDAGRWGGGVYINEYSKFILINGIISQNTGEYGGGVAVDDNGTVIMNGGVITQNHATKAGGGIASDGTIIMNGGSILKNTAKEWSNDVGIAGEFIQKGGRIGE